jgi:hypothetical protein
MNFQNAVGEIKEKQALDNSVSAWNDRSSANNAAERRAVSR